MSIYIIPLQEHSNFHIQYWRNRMLHTDKTYMLWKVTFPEISCKTSLTDSPSFFYKAAFKKLLNVILKMFWHLCASFEFPGNFRFCGFPRIFKQMLSCINCAFHEQIKGLSDLNDYICLSLLVSIFPFQPLKSFQHMVLTVNLAGVLIRHSVTGNMTVTCSSNGVCWPAKRDRSRITQVLESSLCLISLN